MRKVIVEVRGGVAEVSSCPEDVQVEIIDYDNLEDEEIFDLQELQIKNPELYKLLEDTEVVSISVNWLELLNDMDIEERLLFLKLPIERIKEIVDITATDIKNGIAAGYTFDSCGVHRVAMDGAGVYDMIKAA